MVNQKIAIVVDRSGSMAGKEADTVGGINTCISQLKLQKENNDVINVSLKLFDHEQILLWDSVPLEQVQLFQVSDFVPRGSTSLLDVIGDTLIHYINMKKETSDAFDNCCVFVSTDGDENTSKRWTRTAIKDLITVAETFNIKVMYLAANQDAILVAQSIGISRDQAINYDETPETVQAVFRSAAASAHRHRTGGSVGFRNTERQASQPRSSVPQASQPRSSVPPTGTSRIVPDCVNSNEEVLNVQYHRPPTPILLSTIPLWKEHLILDSGKEYQWETVKNMIEELPDLINVQGGSAKRWALLHQAANSNNEVMTRYLLDKGADKTLLNRDGNTAYDLTSNENLKTLLLVN
jgi:uncharacterized protein YegL